MSQPSILDFADEAPAPVAAQVEDEYQYALPEGKCVTRTFTVPLSGKYETVKFPAHLCKDQKIAIAGVHVRKVTLPIPLGHAVGLHMKDAKPNDHFDDQPVGVIADPGQNVYANPVNILPAYEDGPVAKRVMLHDDNHAILAADRRMVDERGITWNVFSKNHPLAKLGERHDRDGYYVRVKSAHLAKAIKPDIEEHKKRFNEVPEIHNAVQIKAYPAAKGRATVVADFHIVPLGSTKI